MRESLKELEEIFAGIRHEEEHPEECRGHWDMDDVGFAYSEMKKDLKAYDFIRSVFEIHFNGDSITFVNGNTSIIYKCKSRKEYEELRKVL